MKNITVSYKEIEVTFSDTVDIPWYEVVKMWLCGWAIIYHVRRTGDTDLITMNLPRESVEIVKAG